jgi:hypothetical protein
MTDVFALAFLEKRETVSSNERCADLSRDPNRD